MYEVRHMMPRRKTYLPVGKLYGHKEFSLNFSLTVYESDFGLSWFCSCVFQYPLAISLTGQPSVQFYTLKLVSIFFS